MMRNFIFSSPGKYVQGSGVLDELGGYLSALGSKAFLIASNAVWTIVEARVKSSLKKAGIPYRYECFKGESSQKEIARLASLAFNEPTSVVVGLGGGKTLDTAKAVADELKLSVAIVPTVASSDAPCSALSVIYTDEGVFDSYRVYGKHPELVLLDTAVCVQAPVRFFASGIADGLATYVEALAVKRTNALSMLGGKPTIASMAIAAACEETLLTYGYSAYQAVKKHIVTPAVESVVEANTLLSGLGFENAGLAGAHAIHNGFGAIQGEIHHLTHGEKVAYGTLTQMVLEPRPDEEIRRYIRFYRSIKMPTTLKEIHLENESFENLVKVGRLACSEKETLRHLNPFLSAEDVAQAMIAVDAFSRTVRDEF